MSPEQRRRHADRDWFGIGCSGLCMVHCAAPLLIVAFGGSLAGSALFGGEWFHLALLVLVPAIACWSFLPSLRVHRRRLPLALAAAGVALLLAAVTTPGASEAGLSIAGGALMITAHALNRRHLLAFAALETVEDVKDVSAESS